MKFIKENGQYKLQETMFEDMVANMINGTKPVSVRLAVAQLDSLKDFALIIPRTYLSNITAPYILAEIDYTGWPEADAEPYKSQDAVMIKRDKSIVLQ